MSWDPRFQKRRDHFDPCPPGGLLETLATRLYARFDVWPEQFVDIAHKYPELRLFDRVRHIVDRLRRERPWETPDEPSNGGRYRIHRRINGVVHTVLQDLDE